MRRPLLLGAVAGAAFAALALAALAQSVTQDNLSGSECWNAGQGPGGPATGFVCSDLVQGGTGHVTLTIAGSFTIGGSATTTRVVRGGNLLVTAQPAAATITMQPNPVPDGAIVGYCNVTGSAFATNAVTMVANSGQTMSTAVTVTTQAAGTCAKVQFHRATTTWYRVQ